MNPKNPPIETDVTDFEFEVVGNAQAVFNMFTSTGYYVEYDRENEKYIVHDIND